MQGEDLTVGFNQVKQRQTSHHHLCGDGCDGSSCQSHAQTEYKDIVQQDIGNQSRAHKQGRFDGFAAVSDERGDTVTQNRKDAAKDDDGDVLVCILCNLTGGAQQMDDAVLRQPEKSHQSQTGDGEQGEGGSHGTVCLLILLTSHVFAHQDSASHT